MGCGRQGTTDCCQDIDAKVRVMKNARVTQQPLFLPRVPLVAFFTSKMLNVVRR